MNPFKAYDIRGVYPQEVHEDLAYDIGRALPLVLKAKTVVIGRDGRLSSDSLFDALLRGLLESGTNVVNIGVCSTPQFYYAIYSSDVDGGVMITASHNPKDFNGFKICEANAKPIFKENKLPQLESFIDHGQFKIGVVKGHHIQKDISQEYTKFFSGLKKETKKFNVLIDTGNGMGIFEAKTLQKLFPHCTFDVLFEKIDGRFPNHECNPVIEKEYTVLKRELIQKNYDFSIAFDGDGDRVTFFTQKAMIPPDLITAIIGKFVANEGEKVGFEVRTSQGVPAYLEKYNIIPCLYPSGHAYIKKYMQEDKAVFAGEKSGHYFYQNLHNTDSSLFTVMNMLALLSSQDQSLQELADEVQGPYVNSGELNYPVPNPDVVIELIKKEYKEFDVKTIDGVSVYGKDFFFNVRKSNTENLVRINIESIEKQKVQELQTALEQLIARN